MFETLEAIRRFLETAGPVLWLIGFTAMLLGAMIIERYWYFRQEFTRQSAKQVDNWKARSDRHSWHALRIRDALISDADTRLNCTLPLIQMLVAICPLLGLLGTVTGMIVGYRQRPGHGLGHIQGDHSNHGGHGCGHSRSLFQGRTAA